MILRLLMPEWQGYGAGTESYDGASALALSLFGDGNYTTFDAPVSESLTVTDGVLGLKSIAPRFVRALEEIHLAAPDRIFTVGGTCAVELAPIAYLNERYGGQLAVLWLDAHGDLNTPQSSPSGRFHGMVLRALMGEGSHAITRAIARFLDPAQVFLVGTRDLDPPELEYVTRQRIEVVGEDAFHDPGRLAEFLREQGYQHLYIHFDVDVLNPQHFSSALIKTPAGGPSLPQAIALIDALARSFNVAGLSVLEYCQREKAQTRALAAALAPIIDIESPVAPPPTPGAK